MNGPGGPPAPGARPEPGGDDDGRPGASAAATARAGGGKAPGAPRQAARRRHRPWLWTAEHWGLAVFVLALALRCGFCLAAGPSAPPTAWGDDVDYDTIARNLVGPAHVYQNTWFPPGYPLFLAAFYGLLGPAAGIVAVRLLQAVLSAATCWVTYALVRNAFGTTAGRVAAVLLALYPGHVYMSWRLMAETLFTLLMALSVLAAQRAVALHAAEWRETAADPQRQAPVPWQPPRRAAWPGSLWAAAGAGMALGAATLVKSNLVLLVPVMIAWLAWASPGPARRRLTAAAVMAAGCALLLLAVPLANRFSPAHRASWLPGNGGPTLWWSNNPLADGYFVDPDDTAVGRAFIARHHLTAPAIAARDPFVRGRADRELALAWIRENPGSFLALAGRKLWNAFGPLPHAALFSRQALPARVQALVYGALLPLFAAGLWLARRRWRQAMPLYLVVGSYTVMTIVFYGTPRFTLVIMPYLMAFAGLALAAAASRWAPGPAAFARPEAERRRGSRLAGGSRQAAGET
jgi:4-amino-4-deoxy-L-arabinose transferase-like glycosyltransferase